MSDLAVIILAAGGSRRMGRPKQLLEINGQTLIRRTAKLALCFSAEVVVVLGNEAKAVADSINNLAVATIINDEWSKGMAGSLKKGLSFLSKKNKLPKQILVLLCDQPLVNEEYLQKLYSLFLKSEKKAAASVYNNIFGVPAIFDFQTLKQFTEEEEDAGARYLLKKLKQSQNLITLAFPEGAIDLDTPEEYQNFLKKYIL